MKRLPLLIFVLVFTILVPFTPQTGHAKDGYMKVHFIDVGQADSILIETPEDKHILIDAGAKPAEKTLEAYLKEHNIKTLDAIIATHPHHDHIGALPELVKHFQVKAFYMPNVSNSTATYAELRKALKKQAIMIFMAKAGDKIAVEPNVVIKFIGPIQGHYDSLNDESYVIKCLYKHNSFLLMADAGEQSETELLSHHVDVQADVIKIGHHGADTGSTLPFLKEVNPDAAIISAAKRDKYGFPSKAVISRLKYLKIPIYRTDKLGSIVAVSDGLNIAFTYEHPPHQTVRKP